MTRDSNTLWIRISIASFALLLSTTRPGAAQPSRASDPGATSESVGVVADLGPDLDTMSFETFRDHCRKKVDENSARIEGEIEAQLTILRNNPSGSAISRRAEERLRELGRSACARLIREIRNPEPDHAVASIGARVLGSLIVLPEEVGWQGRIRNEIADLLRNGSLSQKVLALEALRNDEDPGLIPHYVKVLESGDFSGQTKAARKLRQLEASEAVPSLRVLLDHDNYQVRKLAVESLAAIDPAGSTDVLLGRLDDASNDVRKAAYDALAQCPDSASVVSRLQERLSVLSSRLDAVNPDPIQLQETDWLLAAIGRAADGSVIEDLRALLRKTTQIRIERSAENAILIILTRLQENNDRRELAAVRPLLSSTRARLQKAAIATVRTLKDQGALEDLYRLLQNSDQATVLEAVRALGAIGDRSARPKLRSLLKANNPRQVVLEAAYSLSNLGDFSGVDEVVGPIRQRLLKDRANVYAMVDLADAYKRLNKLNDAITWYKKALQSNRLANRGSVLYRLAAVYSLNGQTQPSHNYLLQSQQTGYSKRNPDEDPDFENLRNAVGALSKKPKIGSGE